MNLLGGCEHKIYNMTTVVKFVFCFYTHPVISKLHNDNSLEKDLITPCSSQDAQNRTALCIRPEKTELVFNTGNGRMYQARTLIFAGQKSYIWVEFSQRLRKSESINYV